MSRKQDTVLAFLVGAAVGGAAALLLAPEKGEVTRRRLREGGGKAYDKSKQALSRAATAVGDGARDASEAISETARQRMGAVRAAVTEGKDAYRRELDRG